jgi:Polyketide cyclase / dehydrase and lipid transport
MPTVAESVHVRASLAESWDLYFDPSAWPAWVDGFGSVESSAGYPEVGGTLRWRSTAAGRGTVTERVLEREPRRLHRIAFTDPESEGELASRFEIEAGREGDAGTRVGQEMTYRLLQAGPLTRLTDAFFIRPQIRRSLRRTLERFRAEVEARSTTAEGP